MAQLPLIKTSVDLPVLMPKWKSQLDPVLANILSNGQLIQGIILAANTPLNINHSLGQLPNGWFPTDQTGFANLKRTQPFNTKTITLEASANTTISIWIF